MGLLKRRVHVGTVAAVGLAMVTLTGAFATAAIAAAPTSAPQFVALANSVNPTTDHPTGNYQSPRMSVEVTLSPRNASALTRALKSAYTKGSPGYHKWLGTGQFAARYAPGANARGAVAGYLQSAGLTVTGSSSPFLLRATGSSQQIAAAFGTALSTYRDPQGIRYFANSTAVRMPSSIAPDVLGVVGLSDTVRLHSMTVRARSPQLPMGKSVSAKNASCETGYVTAAQLFNAVDNGVGFPYGYGGGPGCSGLTPSQVNSIYGAPHVGQRGKGAGVTLGLFELSAYRASDIATWAHHFYGAGYTPKLTDINVDGGPLTPVCPPAPDTCPPNFNGYAGDIEVDADIEVSLAVAPAVQHVEVYNAPNDFTGQTALDEFTAIANQNTADTVSSSWSVCENDVSAGYVQAENLLFEQMALQGQSMFGSSGDTGAFSCIRSDGTNVLNMLDPPTQPWVTSVGGTSLEGFNPDTSSNPGTPPAGTETVWNVDNLCSNQAPGAANDGHGGLFWCNVTGAAGGGFSQWWGRPFYQFGPGVSNPAFPTAAGSKNADGITECALAKTGTPCRLGPDVSAMADEYNGYAEYCTGGASTPFSVCATFSGGQPVPGWFAIGGTSLSSPLWAAIIADRVGYQGSRTGNINPLVYLALNLAPHQFFRDITGIGPLQQVATSNGLYPTTPGYDMATGVGSPKMSAVITAP